jgi:hypothetical protein
MGNQVKKAADIANDVTADEIEFPAVEVSVPITGEVTADETPIEQAVVSLDGVEVRSNRDMIGMIMVDGVNVDLPKFNEVVPDHLRAIALAAGWGYKPKAE